MRTEFLASVSDAAKRIEDGPVLFCMSSGQTVAAAEELVEVAPDVTVVSAQNGVDNDSVLDRYFPRVLGLVVRQQRQFPAFPVRYTEFKRRELRRLDVNLERVRVILVRDQIVPVWGCRKLRPNICTFQLIP